MCYGHLSATKTHVSIFFLYHISESLVFVSAKSDESDGGSTYFKCLPRKKDTLIKESEHNITGTLSAHSHCRQ